MSLFCPFLFDFVSLLVSFSICHPLVLSSLYFSFLFIFLFFPWSCDETLRQLTSPTARCQRNDLVVVHIRFEFAASFQCVTLCIFLFVCFCNHWIVKPCASVIVWGKLLHFFYLIPCSDNSVWKRQHCTTSSDGQGRGTGRCHLDKTNCQLPSSHSLGERKKWDFVC